MTIDPNLDRLRRMMAFWSLSLQPLFHAGLSRSRRLSILYSKKTQHSGGSPIVGGVCRAAVLPRSRTGVFNVLKKYLILVVLGVSALINAPAWAQITDSEAMNMAGLQRSLGQRMAKNYLMLGADVRVDAAQRQLQETVERFDAGQKALNAYAPNPEIKAALAKVDATWVVYRQQVEAKPEHAKAAALMATCETLLQQTQTVTDEMAKHLGQMGATVNRSGWARVQTQRIAMLYMVKAWRVDMPNVDAKMDKAVSDFETILTELEARGTPNEEIAAAQRRARAHWGFTLKGIDLHNTQSAVPTVITVSTDSLFRQLNELTRLYAGLKAAES